MYKESREAIHSRRNSLNINLESDEFKICLKKDTCTNVPRK